MKKIIFLAFLLVPALTIKGQQDVQLREHGLRKRHRFVSG